MLHFSMQSIPSQCVIDVAEYPAGQILTPVKSRRLACIIKVDYTDGRSVTKDRNRFSLSSLMIQDFNMLRSRVIYEHKIEIPVRQIA